MEPGGAMTQATEAMRLADTTPALAISAATRALRAARRCADLHAAALAEQAWGHSLLQGGEVNAAIRHLRSAVRYAAQAGATPVAGSASIKLAFALVQRGRAPAGLRAIDAAVRELDGVERTRALAQRGIIRYLIGQLDDAFADLEVAVRELRAAGDRVHVQRALVNRGIVLAERHQFTAAIADLREAERLATELGRHLVLGAIAQNIGFVEIRRGDVPAALAALEHAERCMTEHGGQVALVLWDRAELLLSVGLVAEARQAAEQAATAFERDHRRLMVPTVRLQIAHAAFLDRDWTSAVRFAALAEREFGRQRRTEWAALARLIGLRARLAGGGEPGATDRRAVEHMVDTLVRAGWRAAAVEARLVAAQLAGRGDGTAPVAGEPAGTGRRDDDRAGQHLREAAAARRRGPAALRARGWFAEALLRRDAGDDRGALRALRTGLRILDEHDAALGAADLRAHSAVHRRELVGLGLRMALRAGRPAGVFQWAERGRASRLHRRPARPPADPVLAALLAELRATAREIDSATAGRRPAVAGRLTAHQVELERRIRDHVRRQPGGDAPSSGPASASAVAAALGRAGGGSALVEYVQLDGDLYALTMVAGRLRLAGLGPVAAVADLVARLPFALRRLADPPSAEVEVAAGTLLRRTAERLDAALLRPLPELGGRALVVVPTGVLHSVPWSTLPSCRGRPVSVSPSATLWHDIDELPAAAPATVTVAAGPRLDGAREEAIAVAAIHGTTALVDGLATVHGVLDQLSITELAHLAAHGRLTPDNPLFCELQFHDGPLLAHDVERLPKAPRTVVLAACDTGRSVVCAGDELLGLAATFIGRGTAHLVASVIPVPDAATAPLMIAFHRQLASGRAPAEALAAVTAGAGAEPAEVAAAAGFVCLGR